jgi:hypothetical protein
LLIWDWERQYLIKQAYLDGLLPACGESAGKPLFCPSDLVTRAWAAYLVVEAKDLPLSP